jgi:hypothetical protein
MADEATPIAEYSISVKQGDFPTVWLTFKDDDGKVHGPFEFVPPYAHALSDELCIASARATKKTTGAETPAAESPADAS